MRHNAQARFDFGENWKQYAKSLSGSKIDKAVSDLQRLFENKKIEGKSFLDIGSGSGLHTLAAIRLGAREVHAFDVDPKSVETTKNVLMEHATNFPFYVEQKDILNAVPSINEDSYDIVYSWGVLHHTGDMWRAISNAAKFVKPNGLFILAVYKKTPLCEFWKIEKSIYSRLPSFLQFPITLLFSFLYLSGITFSGRNPVGYVKNYTRYRGMNFWHDMIDWLGGYPYESASPEEVKNYLEKHGFSLVKLYNSEPSKAWGLFGTGCAEYVFNRVD